MIVGGKLIAKVFINSLQIKIIVLKKGTFTNWLIPVSVGLKRIVKNVIIKKKTIEYFKLFLNLIKHLFYKFNFQQNVLMSL